ncbi:MAG: hypothetical protein QM689_04265 [Oscillospiraceae bacterium]
MKKEAPDGDRPVYEYRPVKLERSTWDRVKAAAQISGGSMNAFIAAAIEDKIRAELAKLLPEYAE